MANRTGRDAATVRGTNPQYLVEKIIRQRIYDSKFWKEECFALSAELLVDKGMDLRYIGGIYAGNVKPTPFLCLLLKMLQLQPEKDIVVEFIRQEDFKYIRALGATYVRLVFNSVEVYRYLEPLFNDFRKLRYMNKDGRFELMHMDELVDNLLREERYFDIQLPRLQKRIALEETNELEPYKSALDDDLERMSSGSDSESDDDHKTKARPSLISKRRTPSPESLDDRAARLRVSDRERERQGDGQRLGIVGDARQKEREREQRHRDKEEKEREKRRAERGEKRSDGKEEEHRRKRSRSKSRERKRSTSRDRRRESDRGKHGDRGSNKTDEQREVDEANELRAKLGLKPLQP